MVRANPSSESNAPTRLLIPQKAQSADRLFNPASTMKLITTYAALDLLGADKQWTTTIGMTRTAQLNRGTIQGDTVIQMTGDPSLSLERWRELVIKLRQQGIHQLRGKLILDGWRFPTPAHDPAAFDQAPLRSYNAGASAFLVNDNQMDVLISPNLNDETAEQATLNAITPALNVSLYPPLPHHVVQIDSQLIRNDAINCDQWRDSIDIKFDPESRINKTTLGNSAKPVKLVLTGQFNPSCGVKSLPISPLPPERYASETFRWLWQAHGGRWTGTAMIADEPITDMTALASTTSLPLNQLITPINKYSNNVRTRQLFLNLGVPFALRESWQTVFNAQRKARDERVLPAEPHQRAIDILREWLTYKGLPCDDSIFENGAGLSRIERVTPRCLAHVLTDAYASPWREDLFASLPIAGIDGTLSKRFTAGALHQHGRFKTGTLRDSRALAGLLHQPDGDWIVVMMTNSDATLMSVQQFDQLVLQLTAPIVRSH
jgi:D-alanyl-D-alanine carboxypeptidase/D-alanyl-D-alanine-endopeptidase (penicillin-binding protein 4)